MRTTLFLALLAASGFLAWTSVAIQAAVNQGDKPTIQWKAVDGKEITNASLKDHVTIVDFWATWCPPCMHEAPHMVQLYNTYSPRGLRMVGVSLDRDVENMKKVAKEKGLVWPQVFENAGRVADTWGVDSIPRTFIISPAGEVLWTGHPAEMDAPLQRIMNKYGK